MCAEALLRRALPLVLLAALAIPAAATASTVTYGDAQGLRLVGGPSEVNNAEIYDAQGEEGPPSFVLSDSAGITAGSGCVGMSAQRAYCEYSTPRLTVKLGTMHDALDLGSLDSGFEVAVGLGSGPDQMFGSDSADVVSGGGGRDYIPGGRGNDVLIGGAGIDALFGGPGRDKLRAADGRRDQVLNCGRGNDFNASLDPGMDPHPVSC